MTMLSRSSSCCRLSFHSLSASESSSSSSVSLSVTSSESGSDEGSESNSSGGVSNLSSAEEGCDEMKDMEDDSLSVMLELESSCAGVAAEGGVSPQRKR